jgi:hypothetical protein
LGLGNYRTIRDEKVLLSKEIIRSPLPCSDWLAALSLKK